MPFNSFRDARSYTQLCFIQKCKGPRAGAEGGCLECENLNIPCGFGYGNQVPPEFRVCVKHTFTAVAHKVSRTVDSSTLSSSGLNHRQIVRRRGSISTLYSLRYDAMVSPDRLSSQSTPHHIRTRRCSKRDDNDPIRDSANVSIGADFWSHKPL